MQSFKRKHWWNIYFQLLLQRIWNLIFIVRSYEISAWADMSQGLKSHTHGWQSPHWLAKNEKNLKDKRKIRERSKLLYGSWFESEPSQMALSSAADIILGSGGSLLEVGSVWQKVIRVQPLKVIAQSLAPAYSLCFSYCNVRLLSHMLPPSGLLPCDDRPRWCSETSIQNTSFLCCTMSNRQESNEVCVCVCMSASAFWGSDWQTETIRTRKIRLWKSFCLFQGLTV